MAKCPACKSKNLRKVSAIRNLSSWAKRFTSPLDIPELLWDSAKGLGAGARYLIGDDSVIVGFPVQCEDCDTYSVVCTECDKATRTTYPAGGTSKTCKKCGQTLYIPDL